MLQHKSFHVRKEVWQQLRINSELSGVPLRDFLTYLIEQSQPVREGDGPMRAALQAVAERNKAAADPITTSGCS